MIIGSKEAYLITLPYFSYSTLSRNNLIITLSFGKEQGAMVRAVICRRVQSLK